MLPKHFHHIKFFWVKLCMSLNPYKDCKICVNCSTETFQKWSRLNIITGPLVLIRNKYMLALHMKNITAIHHTLEIYTIMVNVPAVISYQFLWQIYWRVNLLTVFKLQKTGKIIGYLYKQITDSTEAIVYSEHIQRLVKSKLRCKQTSNRYDDLKW